MRSLLVVLLIACANAASIDQHIVSGIEAKPHEFPEQLALMRAGTFVCGAVLIRKNVAITAAHCVTSSLSFEVRCGLHSRGSPGQTEQKIAVTEKVVHPNYNSGSQSPAFPNDIAVLFLAKDVEITEECRPAVLEETHVDEKRSGIISGWGRLSGGGQLPDTLRKGTVEVMTHSACSAIWRNTVHSQYHICVIDNVFGACNGDSGGPAFVNGTVIGLASFVARGCLVSYPSAYVRVSTYIDWINGVIGSP